MLRLTFADGGEAVYFVPLVGPEDGPEAADALAEAHFLAWLADGFRDERSLSLDDGSRLTWRRSRHPSAAWWENPPAGADR
jgi:hypothetical protein